MHLLYQILPYTTADLSARNSQLDSLSDPLETSQTRIEAQRQTTLANQLRSNTPIMSHSLDASSPEGRQTQMELRKHLRNEGITPAKIQQDCALSAQRYEICPPERARYGRIGTRVVRDPRRKTVSTTPSRRAPLIGATHPTAAVPPSPFPVSPFGSAPLRFSNGNTARAFWIENGMSPRERGPCLEA